MCDTLPDVIYNTPVSHFRDGLADWLADDALQADVLDAVMQVLAASESEADVKLVLAACREHCTPQPSLTLRLLSAMSECSVAAHKCLVIEQLPHFCTSTAAEVSAAIAACRSEYNQQPALRLPIIAALAAMHIPHACQPQLVAYITDALASASPADYPTLLRSALRCLPLSATLPILQTMRRLSLTIDCDTAGQLLHTLVEVRTVSGDKVMAWVEAVEASRGELGVMDVLVLLALLTGGEDEEEDAVWRCFCRCVTTKRLSLRRLRDVLSRPWLDVLSPYVPALGVLSRRLVSTSDSGLREWARQLLPGVFISLSASQVEMRRVLLSGCSKSYQAEAYNDEAETATGMQATEEQRFLFMRAELCADVFLRVAHAAPGSLVAHLSYLDSVMDFPDALYPLVLHRLAYAIALTLAASPVASSHANRLCNELTKLLTMGNTAGRKTALIVASHLIRAVGVRCASGGECGWLDGLMRRSVAALTNTLRAVVDAVSGVAGGVSMLKLSYGGELLSDGTYVLDGEWNVSCVALDGLSSIASHLPSSLLGSVAVTVKQAIAELAVVSFDVPSSLPSRPCVLFAHRLPDSLLCHLADAPSASAATSSPILLVHSFYLSVTQRSTMSPLRLSFLPLLFRSYLTCLALSPAASSTTLGGVTTGRVSTVASFLQCAYELPATAAGDTLPADAALLLDTGLCAAISYQCCMASIEITTCSSSSPALSRPLLTAFSTMLHLLDLVVECDKQLRVREQEWREQEHADEAGTPSWLSSAHLLHDALDALPLPDALLLTAVLQFCLSSPSLPAVSSHSTSTLSFSPSSLLRYLYQSAYRPAASTATAGLFTDTGFFSLLHIALRSVQLLLKQHRADPFLSHSSPHFLPADTAVRFSLSAAHPSLSLSPSFSSSPSVSTYSSSPSLSVSSSSSSSLLVLPSWPLVPPALSSLVSRCASAGLAINPIEVVLLRDNCLSVLFASLEALCSLEQDNRKEPYIAPPSVTKRATKKRTAPSPTPPSPLTPLPTVATLTGKEERLEDDELVTPFQRRKRGRRKQQQPSTDIQPTATMDSLAVVEEGPAVAVSFSLPDQSSHLMVADCVSLLSTHICHMLSLSITRCQERQALDERDWPLTCQALVDDMLRATQSTATSLPSSTIFSPLQSLFNRQTALALRHTCSSTSLASWSLARVLQSLDGSLPLSSCLLQQLLSVYPHNQLLATSVSLRLLPLPTAATTVSPASLLLSNLSIRSPQLLKLFDAAARSLLSHCSRHIPQPAAAGREDGWVELTTPLQSSKLAGGLHGDDWTLHWLSWQYCETADTYHVERLVEWMLHCMYELLEGEADDRDAEEDEVDPLMHRVALTGHPRLATLTASSFLSYFHLLLLLVQLQLAKLQPSSSTSRPSASTFVAGFHRTLLIYCHLLQAYLLAADISPPPQRLRLSSNQPTSSTPSPTRQSKRSRPSSARSQCRPLCPLDPSCSVPSAGLTAAHTAVLSSFVFVSRLLRIHLPVAVSSEIHSAAGSALHSTQLLDCINLCLYATEQAELITVQAPVVATPTRVGRKRKSGTAADASSSPSSTSLQLLKSVELLRATIDSLVAPYGYTMQSSYESAVDNGQTAADFHPSPLPALPQHSLSELLAAQHATDRAAAAAVEHETEQQEEADDDEEEEWSEEGDESDEPVTGRLQRVSRFHQRMDDEESRSTKPRAQARTRPSRGHHSRLTLFDSTDDDDEEYVAEEEGEEEKKEEIAQQAARSRAPMEGDDDIESGKDEADDER